ncbi:MAG: hypothetical protein PHC86_00355 [Eubacteriales bacterium]|nr:hypothetical protein [Eubacteriales bacterium]
MGELGGFTGWLIVFCYGMAIMNYVVRWTNKRWFSKLHKDSLIKRYYLNLMRFIVQNHRWFALTATAALILHFIMQILYRWVSLTGLIALALLLTNVGLGIFGYYFKKSKRTRWFVIHRTAALILVVAIIVHVLLA